MMNASDNMKQIYIGDSDIPTNYLMRHSATFNFHDFVDLLLHGDYLLPPVTVGGYLWK